MKINDYFHTRMGLLRIAILVVIAILSALISKFIGFHFVDIDREMIFLPMGWIVGLTLVVLVIAIARKSTKKPVKFYPVLCVGVFAVVNVIYTVSFYAYSSSYILFKERQWLFCFK
ncbi:MAG: hypothetical protein IJT12_03940 [Paludibacteraceae bacterium]|nr:hypothetical protein [Paludibacteraceae bacterium]